MESEHDLIPGEAKACKLERKARLELIENIQKALGTEATRLEPGTGIRGVLSHIVDRLDTIDRKVGSKNGNWSLPKKVGLLIVLILLGIGDARWVWQQISPHHAQAATVAQ